MAVKPITELAEDLRKFVEEGRAQAGPRIVLRCSMKAHGGLERLAKAGS